MTITIKSVDISKEHPTCNFKIDKPSNCPHCGISLDPIFLSSNFIDLNNSFNQYRLFVQFLCNTCKKAFTAEYITHECEMPPNCNYTNYITSYPTFHSTPTHSEEIQKLSPMYVKIHYEAHYAEELDLKEICGMGYRKALEFLVKDYAIKINPENEKQIKMLPLSKCITEYIDNKKIKALAIASAWLGNDETHYIRKHKDYNLDSLKSFINATESFINSDMEAIKAEQFINSSY